MTQDTLIKLLEEIKSGNIDINDAAKQLSNFNYEDIGIAKIDHNRELRTGFPEVIMGQGKTAEQISKIANAMITHGSNVIITRIESSKYELVKQSIKSNNLCTYFDQANILFIKHHELKKTNCKVLVVTAGTSDIAVAEEAAITAELCGNTVLRLYDAGVAGVHRLFANIEIIKSANVIIAIAGMEGALPSLITGLVSVPVISVPTSTGYGTNFGGLTALFAMLNSCASGLTVVNVDNGFGAGFFASRITSQISSLVEAGTNTTSKKT